MSSFPSKRSSHPDPSDTPLQIHPITIYILDFINWEAIQITFVQGKVHFCLSKGGERQGETKFNGKVKNLGRPIF